MPMPDNAPKKEWSSTIQDFFRRSKFEEAALSPSGRLIAAIVPGPTARGMLVAMDLQKRSPWPVLSFSDIDIVGFVWINEHRLIVFAQGLKNHLPTRVFRWVGGGELPTWDDPYFGVLYAVNVDGTRLIELPPGGALRGSYGDQSDDVLVMTWNYMGSDATRFNANPAPTD